MLSGLVGLFHHPGNQRFSVLKHRRNRRVFLRSVDVVLDVVFVKGWKKGGCQNQRNLNASQKNWGLKIGMPFWIFTAKKKKNIFWRKETVQPFPWFMSPSLQGYGPILGTSTPKGSWREIPLFPGNLGWWNDIIWADTVLGGNFSPLKYLGKWSKQWASYINHHQQSFNWDMMQ